MKNNETAYLNEFNLANVYPEMDGFIGINGLALNEARYSQEAMNNKDSKLIVN